MFYSSITFCYVFNYQSYLGIVLSKNLFGLLYIFVLCCFLGRSRMLILLAALPSTSLTMDVFTARNIFFSLSAAVIWCLQEQLSRLPTARSKNCFLSPFFFFFDLKTKNKPKKKEKKRRCSVFSAGCCQRANQKPPPDGEQNSCRLQINVGCNSTAICPRPQLLTAALPHHHHQNSPVLLPETPHLTASLL